MLAQNHFCILPATGVITTKEVSMPPSGFNQRAVKGALEFVKGCYEDLQEEVRDGKHPNMEAAIAYELVQLEKALVSLHIDKEGKIVERRL